CVIEYDPQLWSEADLLNHLDGIEYGAQARPLIAAPPAKPWTGFVLLRKALSMLERLLVPGVQLTIGLSAFACAVFRVPFPVTQILVAASAVPIVCRTSRTLLEEKKIGIDALDCMAATLMITNGKLIETGFMTA